MMKTWLVIILLALYSGNSSADTYKYMDDKGIPCFTDNLKNIPEKFRKKAVLISKDDGKVIISAPPQADRIDESLLPQKEEASVKTIEPSDTTPNSRVNGAGEPGPPLPYRNIAIISSLFLVTLIPTFFVNNKVVNKILKIASLASMLTLLIYVSTFFASKHMEIMKNDAKEMTEVMNKKEEEKGRALRDAIGIEQTSETQHSASY